MTPNQSLLLAPVWLQPSRLFLPLQPHFSHVICGSWSMDTGVLSVDKSMWPCASDCYPCMQPWSHWTLQTIAAGMWCESMFFMYQDQSPKEGDGCWDSQWGPVVPQAAS